MTSDQAARGSPDWLSPESVAQATFTTGFRGYDADQVRAFLVRLAELLRSAAAREAELRAEVEAAERKAAAKPGELDEAQFAAYVGEETARVLTTAREAAVDIRARAEESVARMLQEAEDEAVDIRAEAEAVRVARTTEAEAEAAEIRRAAEEEVARKLTDAERRLADAVAEAEQLREQAGQEMARIQSETEAEAARIRLGVQAAAEAEIDEARRRGRELVAEAQAVRERVLQDLARKRRAARAHLEQLRAGRDRLLEAYAVVRRTLAEVTGELEGVLVEAKHAADVAVRRVEDDDASVEAIEAELAAGELVEMADFDDVEEAEVVRVGAAAKAPAEAAIETSPVAEGSAGEAEGRVAQDNSTPQPITLPPRPQKRGLFRGRRSSAADQLPEGELVPVSPADPVEEVTVVREEPAGPNGADDDVHELFLRLKAEEEAEAIEAEAEADADRVPEGAEAPAEAADDTSPVAEGGAGEAEGRVAQDDSAEGRAAQDDTLLERRDAAVDGLEQQLIRKLKRVLADEQNEVLDRLRRSTGSRAAITVDSLLPDLSEQAARYGEAAADDLTETAGVGRTFYGGNGATPAVAVADVVDGLASGVASRLRDRVESVVHDSDGDVDAITDGVRAWYREWKTHHLADLARDAVVAAFTRGVYDGLPAGAHVRWVVDDGDTPCSDCDDNALAGVIVTGEEFPTGHTCPPAHPGCRCLLVPSDT
jgi:DivIVA domain-containing protein